MNGKDLKCGSYTFREFFKTLHPEAHSIETLVNIIEPAAAIKIKHDSEQVILTFAPTMDDETCDDLLSLWDDNFDELSTYLTPFRLQKIIRSIESKCYQSKAQSKMGCLRDLITYVGNLL